jgi:4-amino-4-deoxy-L-arabinose transferase-like glycosyltransferase
MVNTILSQIAKPPSKYIIWGLLFGVFNYVFILSRVITQPIDFDAGSYVWMSRLLFNPDTSFSSSPVTILLLQLRQMGYPVLIAPFTALFGTGELLRVSVSLLHLLIYWLATYSVYRLARQILGQKSADVIVLLLLALPFPYFLIV